MSGERYMTPDLSFPHFKHMQSAEDKVTGGPSKVTCILSLLVQWHQMLPALEAAPIYGDMAQTAAWQVHLSLYLWPVAFKNAMGSSVVDLLPL